MKEIPCTHLWNPLPHYRKLRPSWISRRSNQGAGLRLQRNNLHLGAQSNLVLKDEVMSTIPLLQPDQNFTCFSLLLLFVSQKLSMLLSPRYPPPHTHTYTTGKFATSLPSRSRNPVSHTLCPKILRGNTGQARREWLKEESRGRMGREENEE